MSSGSSGPPRGDRDGWPWLLKAIIVVTGIAVLALVIVALALFLF
jgi:hypothetical protein